MKSVKDMLPMGSVVTRKNSDEIYVLMGMMHFQKMGEGDYKGYDYIGVTYPFGYIGAGSAVGINEEDIDTVLFTGYSDKSREEMLQELEKDLTASGDVVSDHTPEQE